MCISAKKSTFGLLLCFAALLIITKIIVSHQKQFAAEYSSEKTVAPTPSSPSLKFIPKVEKADNKSAGAQSMPKGKQFVAKVSKGKVVPPTPPPSIKNAPKAEKVNNNYVSADFSPRERFKLWNKVRKGVMSTLGPDHVIHNKHLIYHCSGVCGGWNDRVEGMLEAYILANLTGRQFHIEIRKPPCQLTDIVVPNLVPWKFSFDLRSVLSSNYKDSKPSEKRLNFIDSRPFFKSLETVDLKTIFPDNIDIIYLEINNDDTYWMSVNPLYKQQLSWLNAIPRHVALPTIYQRLFKLSPRMQNKMDEFLKKSNPTHKHRLICAHLRIGQNPSNPFEMKQLDLTKNLPVVWEFFRNHSKSDTDKIFLMTDADEAMEKTKKHPDLGPRLVDAGGPVVHVDRYTSSKQKPTKETLCAGLEKIVFDQHVLMNCDVMLASPSGLSMIAGWLRADDRGLYFLQKQKCFPGRCDLFEPTYWPHGQTVY